MIAEEPAGRSSGATAAAADGERLGVVAIGRNEGERLRRCLESLRGAARRVVYADSASTDGSVALATALGVTCVELDASRALTAARGRTAGLERLLAEAPRIEYVFFVDGDCEVRPEWLATAVRFLDGHPRAAVVCGRRRERFPEQSVYNRLCDMEWDAPCGEVSSCGGDAVMRVAALRQVGPFDPSVVAGEEPELCLRLRDAGWTVWRLPDEMTLHDAAITGFSQWWMRTVRGGYGAFDVMLRVRERAVGGEVLYASATRSARIWAVAWPAAVALGAGAGWRLGGAPGLCVGAGAAVLPWLAQVLRIAARRRRGGDAARRALEYALFTMLAKFAQMQGQMRRVRQGAAGATARGIEYKRVSADSGGGGRGR